MLILYTDKKLGFTEVSAANQISATTGHDLEVKNNYRTSRSSMEGPKEKRLRLLLSKKGH